MSAVNPIDEVVWRPAGAASCRNRRLRGYLLLSCLTLIVAALAQGAGPGAPLPRRIAPRDALLSLGFEANRGQYDRDTQFSLRTPAGPLQLTSDSTVLRTRQGTLRASWPGGRPGLRAAGIEPRPERITYFEKHNTLHTRSYDRVRYDDVYPGIDLEYYRNNGELEHDWIVAPGADPGRIRVRFDGAVSARVNERGDLCLQLPKGELRQRKPIVYQEVDGARSPVAGDYAALGKGEFGYRLGPYDADRPLVIDPVLEFSSYLGGRSEEEIADVAVDASGAPYVCGYTASADFPGALPGDVEADRFPFTGFVARLTPDGSRLSYVSFFKNGNRFFGLTASPEGRAFLTGYSERDFPATPGAFQPVPAGGSDAFVMRLSVDGSRIEAATLFGGSEFDVGYDLALDPDGSVTVVGETRSTDIPLRNPARAEYDGEDIWDAFAFRLNADGGSIAYATYVGSPGVPNDSIAGQATDVSLNPEGSAIITVLTTEFTVRPFRSRSLSVLSKSGEAVAAPAADALAGRQFVRAAVDRDGSVVTLQGTFLEALPFRSDEGPWVLTRLDPSMRKMLERYEFEAGMSFRGMAFNLRSEVVFVGDAVSSLLPSSGSFWPHLGPPVFGPSVLIADTRARQFRFAACLGGAVGSSFGLAVAVGSDGSIFVAGATKSTDFPMLRPAQARLGGDLKNPVRDGYLFKIREERPGEVSGRLTLPPRMPLFRAAVRPEGAGGGNRPGDQRFGVLVIGNAGAAPLEVRISDAFSSTGETNGAFEVISGAGGFTLAPRTVRRVRIAFTPRRAGRHKGHLVITSSDPRNGFLHLPLSGVALP